MEEEMKRRSFDNGPKELSNFVRYYI